jgi:DNA-binding Xre family transcriptional regulator
MSNLDKKPLSYDDIDAINVGERLSKMVRYKLMSINAFSAELGISRQMLNIRMKNSNGYLKDILRYCRILEIDISEFLGSDIPEVQPFKVKKLQKPNEN